MTEKITETEWQRLLRNRKPPRSGRKSSNGSSGTAGGSGVPEWLVTKQLRGSYFRPADNAPTRIRIIPSLNGELFYEYQQAWVKQGGRNSSVISNAWNGERPLPCLLYDKYESAYEEDGQQVADNYKASSQFAMSIVILEDFYEVEVQKGKNTYTNYVQAPAPDRHGHVTEDPTYEGYPKVFGRVQHWSFYSRQKEAFEKSLQAVMTKCVSCKEGSVEAVSFKCSSCDHVFADVRSDRISKDELDFLKSGRDIECDKCGTQASPVVTQECTVQRGYGSSAQYEKGCDHPKLVEQGQPIDLVIRKVPAGTSFAIEILDIETPRDYERLPVMQQNPEIRTDAILDFDRFFGRMKLRDQAFAMFGSADANPYDDGMEDVIDKFFQAKSSEEDLDSIPF